MKLADILTTELLTEVLKIEITDFALSYIYGDIGLKFHEKYKKENTTISNYDLAHKCKDWAWDLGFYYWYENNKLYIKKLYSCKADFEIDIGTFVKPYDIKIDFKACQWILKNKKQLGL